MCAALCVNTCLTYCARTSQHETTMAVGGLTVNFSSDEESLTTQCSTRHHLRRRRLSLGGGA